MGISTSRLCDRRAYRGRIDGEYRMRPPSVASRSRTRGWRTATGPMPVMISRSGRWPWRTTRCWPVSVLRSVCFARNSGTSASTAWVSNARAPLRRISVRESVKARGWASLITLLSDTAYHSFIGEVGALNTTTIRRLTTSRRHQLPAIARRASSYVQRAERAYRNEQTTQHHSALVLGFRRTAELTIRGGGKPYSNMALDADRENGPPPGASPPMRMTASWSGSERTYRIQVRGVKMRRNGEFPSDHTQIGNVATRAPQEKPVSLFILPPRAQASRRCETQATLSGKPPSYASVSVP